MSIQPIACHLPECEGSVDQQKPRRLSDFSFALCQRMQSLLPGARQGEPLCTKHYNHMYANPSRTYFKTATTAPQLPRKCRRTRSEHDEEAQQQEGLFFFKFSSYI